MALRRAGGKECNGWSGGRLTLVPQADGYYTSTEVGTVQPLLADIVRKLASLSISSWNQIAGFLESMRQLRESSGFAGRGTGLVSTDSLPS